MVWYSYLFHNFPQFVVIHTVKGFGIVYKADIDVFLELSRFFNDPKDVGNLISGSSAFSKTSLNKESACVAGDSLISWLGRSPGGGNDNLLQYSCLENSVDRGAW